MSNANTFCVLVERLGIGAEIGLRGTAVLGRVKAERPAGIRVSFDSGLKTFLSSPAGIVLHYILDRLDEEDADRDE